MSQENVEIVRQFSERSKRLDWDGLADLVDPSVEQHGTVGGIDEGRLLRGLGEIRRDYESVEKTWDEHRIEPQEFIDAGDRVVVFLREYQRGKRSGIELAVDTAVIVDLRDGRIVRIQGYMDRCRGPQSRGAVRARRPGLTPFFVCVGSSPSSCIRGYCPAMNDVRITTSAGPRP